MQPSRPFLQRVARDLPPGQWPDGTGWATVPPAQYEIFGMGPRFTTKVTKNTKPKREKANITVLVHSKARSSEEQAGSTSQDLKLGQFFFNGPRLCRRPTAARPNTGWRDILARGAPSWLLRLGFATAAIRPGCAACQDGPRISQITRIQN